MNHSDFFFGTKFVPLNQLSRKFWTIVQIFWTKNRTFFGPNLLGREIETWILNQDTQDMRQADARSQSPTAKRHRVGPVIKLSRKRAHMADDGGDASTQKRITTAGLVEVIDTQFQQMKVEFPYMLRAHGMTNTDRTVLYRIHILARHFLQSTWILGEDLHLEAASVMTKYLISCYSQLHGMVRKLKEVGLTPKAYGVPLLEARINNIFRQLVELTNCFY